MKNKFFSAAKKFEKEFLVCSYFQIIPNNKLNKPKDAGNPNK